MAAAKKCGERKPLRSSTRIALSGIICGLAAVMMFLTGIFPMASFALPAMAGLLLVVLVIELDYKTALLAYVATSIIIFMVTPDRESALLYIFFFGHYSITKAQLEKHIHNRVLEWLAKLAVFNACVVTAYSLIALIFGFARIIEEFGDLGRYSLLIFLLFGNIVFVIYDFCITNMIMAYIKVFRPKFLKR